MVGDTVGLALANGDTGSVPLRLEERGFSQLLAMMRKKLPVLGENGKPLLDPETRLPMFQTDTLFPSAMAWMSRMRPDTLVETFNRHVKDYAAALDDVPVVLYHRRRADGERGLFLAATPTYAPFDAARSIAELRTYLSARAEECRGPVLYDPVSTGFTAQAQTFRMHVHNLSVGDSFQTVLSVRNHDSKGGGIIVQLGVVRVQCINLTCATDNWTSKLRHAGSIDRIERTVRQVHARAGEFTTHFLKAWGQLADAPLRIGRRKYDTVTDAIELGVESGALDISGSKKRDKEAITWGLLQEPGTDQRALVNAITRAARWSGFERELDTFGQERVRLQAAELSGQLVFASAA